MGLAGSVGESLCVCRRGGSRAPDYVGGCVGRVLWRIVGLGVGQKEMPGMWGTM